MTRRRMSQCHICLLAAFLLCTGRSAAQQCKSSTFQTQCAGNGLWVSAAGENQSLGQCTPRQCRDIPTIHGGDIRPRVNSVPVGSSVRVVCNRGFELRGPGSSSPSCLVCRFKDCPICTKQKALRANLVSMWPAASLRASTIILSKSKDFGVDLADNSLHRAIAPWRSLSSVPGSRAHPTWTRLVPGRC